MPELPEVQTTVSDLQKVLPGNIIRDVWTDTKKLVKYPKTFSAFKKEIIGKKVLKVERRGKNILIFLSGKRVLLIHMKLTGFLLFGKKLKNPYIRFRFGLSEGTELGFSDLRKFAKIILWPADKLSELSDINKLGPDPLEKNFTFKKFKEALMRKPKGKIKQVLMNQEVVSGIGNIYSDEILWSAGAHPLRKVSDISANELKKIYLSMRDILKRAIKLRGDSMSDYRHIDGSLGRFQLEHKAYGRKGEVCQKPGCGGVIKRIKIGGRSSCLCPKHQV
jgi:formamidopyrimidine-DNA glycosylase